MKAIACLLLGAALGVVPTGVLAQSQPQGQPAAAGAVQANPDEVVCEKQEVTGSRLSHRKVCLTRSQWEDARRQDRSAIEKAQQNRGMNSSPTKPGG